MTQSAGSEERTAARENPNRARDHLANERTFLAWLRTGLAIVVFGFAIGRFAIAVRQFLRFEGRAVEGGGFSVWFGTLAMVATEETQDAKSAVRAICCFRVPSGDRRR